jgi:HEAT repeat protein
VSEVGPAREWEATISAASESAPRKAAPNLPVLSPAAQGCAAWFRSLARSLKVCRLYKTDNSIVVKSRDGVLDGLARLVVDYGGLAFRFTPTEIYFAEEPVVRPKLQATSDESMASIGEERLPFLFFRDGIRAIRIPLGTPRTELEVFFESLRMVGVGQASHDDMVTLLWQANLNHIEIESAPLEQTIYLSSMSASGQGGGGGGGTMYAWSPAGAEIRADLGQESRSQGMHRDIFDDWELADTHVEVPETYRQFLPSMDFSRVHFRAAWEEESIRNWTDEAPGVLRQVVALDPREETRRDLSHAVVTWLASALQNASIDEAQCAAGLLRELDPEKSWTVDEITAAFAPIDHANLAEYLDEASQEEQARFSALAVALGKPAVGLLCAVLGDSSRVRTRAAVCTALCYLCADDPSLLESCLVDPREHVVLNAVFVLGQIGGPEVLGLLAIAAQHRDPRVRRQVIQSLGSVPPTERVPLLLSQIDTDDAGLLAAVLQILSRDRNPRVARALLDRIASPNFETRSEDVQRALFNALSEVADDEAVPALEAMLKKGGWLARKSFTRVAAARALYRVGTPRARAVITDGLKSRNAAVRSACLDAGAVGSAKGAA